MNIRHLKSTAAAALAAAGFICTSLAVAEAPATSPSTATATKEQRETMAKAHENVAQCLRSDRALADCRQIMMNAANGMPGGMKGGMAGMMGAMDCNMTNHAPMKGKPAAPAADSDPHKH